MSLLGSATSSLASGLFTSLGQLVLLVGGKIVLFLLLRHLHPALSGIFGDVDDPGTYLQIEVSIKYSLYNLVIYLYPGHLCALRFSWWNLLWQP